MRKKMNKNDRLEIIMNKVLKFFHIELSLQKKELLIQIFKFLIVGGTATIIDWIIYYLLYNYINLSPLIANILSFSISVVYNYYISIKWVFNVNNEKNKRNVFIGFIVLSIIGLLITELLLWIFINILGINIMLSKIISTIIVMIFNFITRKIFLE